jgi:hypothetical protein
MFTYYQELLILMFEFVLVLVLVISCIELVALVELVVPLTITRHYTKKEICL